MASLEWINKQFLNLSSKIGVYKLYAGEDFFFEPTPGFYGFISQDTTDVLNEAMHMLANHIGYSHCPIIEDWKGPINPIVTMDYDYTSNEEPPGLIRYNGPYRSKIQICITNKHSPLIMGAILAHELTHYYLFNKEISLPDENENERFTDLATVYLGLGKLTLNGYDTISWKINRKDKEINYTYRVGYLTVNEMAVILYHLCKFRNIPLEKAKENLSIKSQELLTRIPLTYKVERKYIDEQERKKFRKDKIINRFKKIFHWFYKKNKVKDYYVSEVSESPGPRFAIIICGKCNKKMRVPIKENALRVTCPNCENKFIFQMEN
jgi:hypothetical protein